MSTLTICKFKSTAELLDSIRAQTYGCDKVIYSDLFIGSWQPNQIAEEFAKQLGVELKKPLIVPSNPPFPLEKERILPFAQFVRMGIDAESFGNPRLRHSYDLVEQLVIGARAFECLAYIVILPSSKGVQLEDDRALLDSLNTLKRRNDKLVLFQFDDSELLDQINEESLVQPRFQKFTKYQEWMLIPGLVFNDNGLSEELLVSLSSQVLLVPIELRQGVYSKRKALAKNLVQRSDCPLWLRAFGFYHASGFYIDKKVLRDFVSQLLSLNNIALAMIYLDKLFKVSSSELERSIVLVQVQGLRIAQWDFEKVLAEDFFEGIPDALLNFLYLANAWAATVLGNLDKAKSAFNAIAHILSSKNERREEILFIKNLYALYELKSGNLEKALAIEKEIETELSTQPIVDRHLRYINSINQARLYKRKGAYDLMMTYFLKAFATTEGFFTEGDLIYSNFVLANAAESLAHPSLAEQYWIRCYTHWRACQHPAIINARIRKSAGFSETQGSDFNHYFSELLASKISKICRQTVSASACNNVRKLNQRDILTKATKTAFGNEKLTVVTINDNELDGGKCVSKGDGLIEFSHLSDLGVYPQFTDRLILLVDNDSGENMPLDLGEFIVYCFTRNIDVGVWRGQKIFQSHEELIGKLLPGTVFIHRAVRSVDHLDKGSYRITFNRLLKEVTCDNSLEVAILQNINTASTIVNELLEKSPRDEILSSLRTMKARKIIDIKL